MRRLTLCAVIIMLGCGAEGSVAAQAVPTKTITFYNNSNRTLFPVVQAPIRLGADVRDLWMQAQFQVGDVATQVFQTTLLYRIFINKDTGVPPQSSVTLTMPFYTQLLPANKKNLGTVDDQFIDWWNAMRVYVFDGKDATTAAYDYNNDRNGMVIPPIPITPLSGASVPSCTSSTTACEPVAINGYVPGFPFAIPFQLVEYTFGAALEGPPLSIDLDIVNYNISAVDNVYLPAAVGASGNNTPNNTYLGSTEKIALFRSALKSFTGNGGSWPYFVPAYYSPQNPIFGLPTPPPGVKPYPLP
ncbi:MAG TPA: hypothetical protein VMB71_11165, partial [Acetobacteraceae bacterium]|nr:hypothetical protein [Acetobacteraceae bacterium]